MDKFFVLIDSFNDFKNVKLSMDPNNEYYITYEDRTQTYGTPEILWDQIVFVADSSIIYTKGVIYTNYIKPDTGIPLSDLDESILKLSSNYQKSSYTSTQDLALSIGDEYEIAFGKLEKRDDEISTYLTNAYTYLINTKQDIIGDLDTIRSYANRVPLITPNQNADWNAESGASYIYNKPDLSNYLTSETQSDWEEDNTTSAAYILNKPTIPVVPTNLSSFINDVGYLTTETNPNWNESDIASAAYILNKPTIPELVKSDWEENDPASYTYIQNKPDLSNFLTIQTNSNWNETNSSSAAYIQNKPDLSIYLTSETKSDWNVSDSTSSAYILNKPTIPNDSNLVHKTGNEEISGIKTFGDENADLGLNIGGSSPEISLNAGISLHMLSGGEFGWISVSGKGSAKTLQQALDERNNIQADWNVSDSTSYAYILNKPTIPTVPTTSTTVSENDTNPVSGGAVYAKFADLIGTAPAALDTLQEIAYALNNDADLASTLTNQITAKIPKVSNPTIGNFAYFNSDGTIADSSYNYNTFLTSETQLSKGTTTGEGNAVTDITVNNHEITLIKGVTFLTEHQSLKTINNESIAGSGNIVVSGLPQVSSSDNGKILMVVNGQWQLVSPSVLYSGSGVPNNSNGNNGDLYMQTE